jgi:hypothetical protein
VKTRRGFLKSVTGAIAAMWGWRQAPAVQTPLFGGVLLPICDLPPDSFHAYIRSPRVPVIQQAVIMRRFHEALALDHIVPFRIISSEQGDFSGPYS